MKPNTLPIIEAVGLASEPSSNKSKSYAMYTKYVSGELGTGSTRYALARYRSQAVKRSVHTTVHVAVDDSPAIAAPASTGSTPGWGTTE